MATTYIYDSLNRVTNRNYSGGSVTTPNVAYTYDNLPNAKGRLTMVTAGSGSAAMTTGYTSFDILGRVEAHTQTTDGQTYATGYLYNRAGALKEETYPSGRVVKNTLDNVGELTNVESKKNSTAAYSSYANNFTYNAAGGVTSMKLGNNLWESTVFNSRLQPTQIALGSAQNTPDKLKLEYSYGSANNGNVQSQNDHGSRFEPAVRAELRL